MLTNLFTNTTTNINTISLIICSIISIIAGVLIALAHKKTSKYTKGYLTTISMLPFIVQIIIILVNGNLGTGIAIMGAFSLVRFRSIPGSAKEILTVFFAMSVGLAIGTGYIVFASLITIIGCFLLLVYDKLNIFEKKQQEKILKIVIPEDLDYTEVFDDIFINYTKKQTLKQVKMIDMGSLFELTYLIEFKENIKEKQFIDDLRIKNGNLKIILSHPIKEGDL